MNARAVRVGAVVLAWAGVFCRTPAFAQAEDAAGKSPAILLTATIDLLQPPFFGAVESITAEGRGLDGTIPVGKLILLVRPPQTTTAQMRALPDLVTIEEGPVPKVVAAEPAADVEGGLAATARADRAARNLAAIAKGIIGYHETYRCFPPAPRGRQMTVVIFEDDGAVKARMSSR